MDEAITIIKSKGVHMSRKIILTPYQMGALNAYDDVYNIMNSKSENTMTTLLLSQLIQSGVSRFEIIGRGNSKIYDSTFLKNKSTFIESDEMVDISHKIDLIFIRFFGEDIVLNKKRSENQDVLRDELLNLKQYLCGLLFAASRKADYVTVLPRPNIEQIRNRIPPEFYYPINNLLSSIETLDMNLPTPKYSVSNKQLSGCIDLLESNLYSDYCSVYDEILDSTESKNNAINKIEIKGNELVLNNNGILRNKVVQLSFLDSLAEFCNIINKSEFSILLKFFTNVADEFDKNKNRLIIFDFKKTVSEVLNQELSKLK